MNKRSRLNGFVLTCAVAAGFFASCHSSTQQAPEPEVGSVKQDMNAVYDSAQRIYAKLWDRERFIDMASANEIQSDLDRLSNGFHRVERDFPIEQFEPGFRVILQAQQELLADAAARFRAGKKDYVMWRLRGMTGNCVACHSRVGVPMDFAGVDPGSGRGSSQEVLGRGEFLTATRQFDRAREHLLGVVRGKDGISYDSETKFEALQLYLVSAVRVKADYSRAAADFDTVLQEGQIPDERKDIVRSWIEQLGKLAKFDSLPPIKAAEELLRPLIGSDNNELDQQYLVQSLAASRILHTYLLTALPQEQHRHAQYLLAVAYFHLTLRQFEVFQLMLLEQVIRENPRSAEAHHAFELFKARTESNASGPAGMSVEQEDLAKLQELRGIAYGGKVLVVPDTGIDLNQ